jgi:hypothetical protein
MMYHGCIFWMSVCLFVCLLKAECCDETVHRAAEVCEGSDCSTRHGLSGSRDARNFTCEMVLNNENP